MNPYSAAWTVTAVIGALLSAYLIIEAARDWGALDRTSNGRRKRVRVRLISEVLRLTVHGSFAYIGFGALETPVRPESTGNILILLYGNVVLIVNSLLAVWVQRLEPSAERIADNTAKEDAP